MQILRKVFEWMMDSYMPVVILSIIFGLFFSTQIAQISHLSIVFLGLIFFFSALRIDFAKVREQLHSWPSIVFANVLMLFIFPIVTYVAMQSIYPKLAVAFMLLASMPVGMTSPLLVDIAGGKKSIALILTVTTSLLAPFTVPLVTKYLLGQSVDVDFFRMFYLLSLVIYTPFILAQIVKKYFTPLVDYVAPALRPVSILFLGLLIAGVVASKADVILAGLFAGKTTLYYFFALFVFFILLHIVGYFSIFWREHRERLTFAICLTYMNFTLALEIANRFFPEENIVLPIVFSVIPWALLLKPFLAILRMSER